MNKKRRKRRRRIRFTEEVPDAECLICPFSCCSHPFQELFDESYLTTYAKLCIKDLTPHDRRKVLARIENQGCVKNAKI